MPMVCIRTKFQHGYLMEVDGGEKPDELIVIFGKTKM